jgi:hypothetical protein
MRPRLSRRRFLALSGAALAGCAAPAVPSVPELPLYLEPGLGWPVMRGPFLQRDARITIFALPADPNALKRLCELYLNPPAGGRVNYIPLAPGVLVFMADMIVTSLDARDSALGWMRETELSFWAPLAARVPAGGVQVPERLVWFLPYLFVDNPYAIAAGRELYGFAKTLGYFTRPANGGAAFTLDVWGVEQFGPQAEYKPQRLLQVEPAGSARQANQTWAEWPAVWAALLYMLLNGNSNAPAAFDPAALEMPLVLLKQFPAAADPRRACYQSLIAATARVQHFYSGHTLEVPYQFSFAPLASHPLPQILGLPVNAAHTLTALAAIDVHFDFTLELGAEV